MVSLYAIDLYWFTLLVYYLQKGVVFYTLVLYQSHSDSTRSGYLALFLWIDGVISNRNILYLIRWLLLW